MATSLVLLLLFSFFFFSDLSFISSSFARPLPESSCCDDPLKTLSLELVRDTLVRIEDSIVFALIERARFPLNSHAYDASYLGNHRGHGERSIAEVFVRETEVIEAKVGSFSGSLLNSFSCLLCLCMKK